MPPPIRASGVTPLEFTSGVTPLEKLLIGVTPREMFSSSPIVLVLSRRLGATPRALVATEPERSRREGVTAREAIEGVTPLEADGDMPSGKLSMVLSRPLYPASISNFSPTSNS
jgi:hypothetical protein